MKFIFNTSIALLITLSGLAQQKPLDELKKEIINQKTLEKVNYVFLSRTISHITLNDSLKSDWVYPYKLFLITNELDKVIVSEYKNGNTSKAFEISNSKIFKLLKSNMQKLKAEKLNNFEKKKDHTDRPDGYDKMEIDISFNNISYHNKFDGYLLDFSSNSKLKLVELILTIEHEFTKYYKTHPFYVETR
ncbi:hypothetical protein [Flavobacterium terrae]|uniref:Uncharacterized protein n=1 Tax=Flavobacterium terrae TaxID=415425 RepID=A0A1M6G178_9FLAO|nr:hypothetical protein [Flavobacterium terrae]SHJ03690.1 hypothetical protein SAMN05444363_2459 [Flavobacterium terrae]